MAKPKETSVVESVSTPAAVTRELETPVVPPPVRTVPTPPIWFWVGAGCFALLLGVIGYVIGDHANTHTTHNRIGEMSNGRSNEMGNGAHTTRRGGMGKVTAISATSITVQDRMDSATRVYSLTDATKIYKLDRSSGVVSDVKVGDSVMVRTASSSSSDQTAVSVSVIDGVDARSSSSDTSTSSSADSTSSAT